MSTQFPVHRERTCPRCRLKELLAHLVHCFLKCSRVEPVSLFLDRLRTLSPKTYTPDPACFLTAQLFPPLCHCSCVCFLPGFSHPSVVPTSDSETNVFSGTEHHHGQQTRGFHHHSQVLERASDQLNARLFLANVSSKK